MFVIVVTIHILGRVWLIQYKQFPYVFDVQGQDVPGSLIVPTHGLYIVWKTATGASTMTAAWKSFVRKISKQI